MKIYIIGAPGAGKTTLAKSLSQKLNIKYYELDLLIFDDEQNHKNVPYYLNVPKRIVYKRVIKRWLRQKLQKENFNYPPTFNQLIDMLKVTHSYFKKEKKKRKELEIYKDKVTFLDLKNKKEEVKL